jgi:hypothetical protein
MLPCLSTRYSSMMAYRGDGDEGSRFLTLGTLCRRNIIMLQSLCSGERDTATHWIPGWVVPRANLDVMAKREIQTPTVTRILRVSVRSYSRTEYWRRMVPTYQRYGLLLMLFRHFAPPSAFITESYSRPTYWCISTHPFIIIIIIIIITTPFLVPTGAWGIHETFRFTSVS